MFIYTYIGIPKPETLNFNCIFIGFYLNRSLGHLSHGVTMHSRDILRAFLWVFGDCQGLLGLIRTCWALVWGSYLCLARKEGMNPDRGPYTTHFRSFHAPLHSFIPS